MDLSQDDMSHRLRLSHGALMYLIHHMFLPPNVPQEDDFNPEYEMILLDLVAKVLLRFKECLEHDQHDSIEPIIAMVTSLMTVHSSFNNAVCEQELGGALKHLCKKGPYQSVNPCDPLQSI